MCIIFSLIYLFSFLFHLVILILFYLFTYFYFYLFLFIYLYYFIYSYFYFFAFRTGAKFLWKRIPASTKTATPELGLIWAVGQNLWQRDLPAVYTALKQEWSPTVKDIMKAVHGIYFLIFIFHVNDQQTIMKWCIYSTNAYSESQSGWISKGWKCSDFYMPAG